MTESNPHVLGELSKYLNGELPGAQRRRVDAHLESCDSCRRHYEGLLSLRNLIQETPSLMPPEDFIHKFTPSWGVFKILILIGVISLGVWTVRNYRWPTLNLTAKKAPAKPAVVRAPLPVPIETAAPPGAPPADSSVQDLQHLASTLPTPTTAPAENPTAAPAAVATDIPTAVSAPDAP